MVRIPFARVFELLHAVASLSVSAIGEILLCSLLRWHLFVALFLWGKFQNLSLETSRVVVYRDCLAQKLHCFCSRFQSVQSRVRLDNSCRIHLCSARIASRACISVHVGFAFALRRVCSAVELCNFDTRPTQVLHFLFAASVLRCCLLLL